MRNEIDRDRILISRPRTPREGWDELFAEMARLGEDVLLDGDVHLPTEWEEEEWAW
jgi:hypothetical protein